MRKRVRGTLIKKTYLGHSNPPDCTHKKSQASVFVDLQKNKTILGGEILKLYFKILTTAACEIILSATYSTDYFDMKTEMLI